MRTNAAVRSMSVATTANNSLDDDTPGALKLFVKTLNSELTNLDRSLTVLAITLLADKPVHAHFFDAMLPVLMFLAHRLPGSDLLEMTSAASPTFAILQQTTSSVLSERTCSCL